MKRGKEYIGVIYIVFSYWYYTNTILMVIILHSKSFSATQIGSCNTWSQLTSAFEAPSDARPTHVQRTYNARPTHIQRSHHTIPSTHRIRK